MDDVLSEEFRRRQRQRVSSCCKKFMAFLFSQVGLAAMVIAYSILGGFIFQTIEAPFEANVKLEVKAHQEEIMRRIHKAAIEHLQPTHHQMYKLLTRERERQERERQQRERERLEMERERQRQQQLQLQQQQQQQHSPVTSTQLPVFSSQGNQTLQQQQLDRNATGIVRQMLEQHARWKDYQQRQIEEMQRKQREQQQQQQQLHEQQKRNNEQDNIRQQDTDPQRYVERQQQANRERSKLAEDLNLISTDQSRNDNVKLSDADKTRSRQDQDKQSNEENSRKDTDYRNNPERNPPSHQRQLKRQFENVGYDYSKIQTNQEQDGSGDNKIIDYGESSEDFENEDDYDNNKDEEINSDNNYNYDKKNEVNSQQKYEEMWKRWQEAQIRKQQQYIRSKLQRLGSESVGYLRRYRKDSDAEDFIGNKTAFMNEMQDILKDFQANVTGSVKERGWDGKDGDGVQWSYAGALLYAVTVTTTIGYGHVVTKTGLGRFVTIIYALIGIPLTFLYLSTIGNYLADVFRVFYKKICCDICCCLRCDRMRRRQRLRRRRQLKALMEAGVWPVMDHQKSPFMPVMGIENPVKRDSWMDDMENGDVTNEVESEEGDVEKASVGENEITPPVMICVTASETPQQTPRVDNFRRRFTLAAFGSSKESSNIAGTVTAAKQINEPVSSPRSGRKSIAEFFKRKSLPAVSAQPSEISQQSSGVSAARENRSLLSPTNGLRFNLPWTNFRLRSKSAADKRTAEAKGNEEGATAAEIDNNPPGEVLNADDLKVMSDKKLRKVGRSKSMVIDSKDVKAARAAIKRNESFGGSPSQIRNNKIQQEIRNNKIQQEQLKSAGDSVTLATGHESRKRQKSNVKLSLAPRSKSAQLNVGGLARLGRRSNTSAPVTPSTAVSLGTSNATKSQSLTPSRLSAGWPSVAKVLAKHSTSKSQSQVAPIAAQPDQKSPGTTSAHHRSSSCPREPAQAQTVQPEAAPPPPEVPESSENKKISPWMLAKIRIRAKSVPGRKAARLPPLPKEEEEEDEKQKTSDAAAVVSTESNQQKKSDKLLNVKHFNTSSVSLGRFASEDSFVTAFDEFSRLRINETTESEEADASGNITSSDESTLRDSDSGNDSAAITSPYGLKSLHYRPLDGITQEQSSPRIRFADSDDFVAAVPIPGFSDTVVDEDCDEDRERKVRVPIYVCLIIITGYILGGSVLFTSWEGWDLLTGSYFCFVTLSTIGFGDIVPGTDMEKWNSREKLVLCALWLYFGLSLLAMCFNLMQEEVKEKCKWVAIKVGLMKDDGTGYD